MKVNTIYDHLSEFDGNPNMDPSKDQNPIGDHK